MVTPFIPSEDISQQIAHHIQQVLQLMGEDTQREGLQKTPMRVGEAMQFLTQGYQQSAEEILRSALFEEDYRQMVVVKDIPFYSLCEHHMLPFFGKAHVAYIPNGKITGLSKIARVVDIFARRLQVQERMTTQIKECIQQTLDPLGVMVVIEAEPLCMQMRGVWRLPRSSWRRCWTFCSALSRIEQVLSITISASLMESVKE